MNAFHNSVSPLLPLPFSCLNLYCPPTMWAYFLSLIPSPCKLRKAFQGCLRVWSFPIGNIKYWSSSVKHTVRHAPPWECVVRCSKCKALELRVFPRHYFPTGSPFHCFEQFGIWAHERSRSWKRVNERVSSGRVGSRANGGRPAFQITPGDSTEWEKRWEGNEREREKKSSLKRILFLYLLDASSSDS